MILTINIKTNEACDLKFGGLIVTGIIVSLLTLIYVIDVTYVIYNSQIWNYQAFFTTTA